jgi:hypothetical protein
VTLGTAQKASVELSSVKRFLPNPSSANVIIWKGKLTIESVQDTVSQHNQQSNAKVRATRRIPKLMAAASPWLSPYRLVISAHLQLN